MKRNSLFVLFAFALVCPSMHALGGCAQSPENPTALLGLVGSAGAVAAHLWRRRRTR